MLKYKKEIDGLRGISIICVLFFHAKIPFFSGGYFGVDIFFVISGYLITGILIKEKELKIFDIKYFYERRIRRIIPALYVVLIFLCIYSFFFQSPYFSKDLSQSIFFTPIFLQNFLNIYESAQYFILSYDFKSLGHTWSLSLEEQFYFLYPVLLLILINFFRTKIEKTLFILFLSSLVYYLYLGLYTNNSNLLFFFFPSRIWEILAGCLITLSNNNSNENNKYSYVGAVLIVFSIFFHDVFNQQFLLRLLVVIGTSLILIDVKNLKENFISRLLKQKILIFLGLISYSLYLWHVPVYSIFRDFFTFEVTLFENIFLIIFSILISYISYKLIESPFRNKNKFSSNFIFSMFFLGVMIFTTFGYFGHKTNGFEEIKIKKLIKGKEKFYISFIDERNKINNFKPQDFKNLDNEILVIGDSLGADVVNSLKTQKIASKRFILNGPCFEELIDKNYSCGVNLEELKTEALKAKLVLISTDFANENSHYGGIKLYKFLINNNIKVKVVGSINFKYVSSSSFRYSKYKFYNDHQKFYYNNIQPNVIQINEIIKNKIEHDFIDKFSFFCNKEKKVCRIYNNNFDPLFYDTKHLTVNGYYIFGEYLKSKI